MSYGSAENCPGNHKASILIGGSLIVEKKDKYLLFHWKLCILLNRDWLEILSEKQPV